MDQNITIHSDVAQTSSYFRFFLRLNHWQSLMFYLLHTKSVWTTQNVPMKIVLHFLFEINNETKIWFLYNPLLMFYISCNAFLLVQLADTTKIKRHHITTKCQQHSLLRHGATFKTRMKVGSLYLHPVSWCVLVFWTLFIVNFLTLYVAWLVIITCLYMCSN